MVGFADGLKIASWIEMWLLILTSLGEKVSGRVSPEVEISCIGDKIDLFYTIIQNNFCD